MALLVAALAMLTALLSHSSTTEPFPTWLGLAELQYAGDAVDRDEGVGCALGVAWASFAVLGACEVMTCAGSG